MAEITTAEIKEYLQPRQGQIVTLNQVREDHNIVRGSKSWVAVSNIFFQLAEQSIVSPVGRRSGIYKVVTEVFPVRVFDDTREERPPFELIFPRDFNSMMEICDASDIVIREGDVVLIAGMSNYFKTGLCLNFCGENIDKNPILMGSEYTIKTETGYDVSPRFYNRLNTMREWINWTDEEGYDKFTLLPVWEDYAEHIVKNKINIIDWINLPGEYYMISPLMERVKKSLGRGIGILVIQKNKDTPHGIGGGRTREFADCELLLDQLGETEILLTIGKVKEATKPVVGKTYAFGSSGGVKILNFREVKKCPRCHFSGYVKGEKCPECFGYKYVDR